MVPTARRSTKAPGSPESCSYVLEEYNSSAPYIATVEFYLRGSDLSLFF